MYIFTNEIIHFQNASTPVNDDNYPRKELWIVFRFYVITVNDINTYVQRSNL